ncbi:MAG: ABC transporter ATP-binding protein [Anaerolineales bacterium]|nr:ABC transporter ATP-binding protein [Anaerolineales bacterium]
MITVENLQFTYQGTAVPAIEELNFHIKPGEVFGFLGPSGAGKSTTQKILTGLLKTYQGRVRVLGKDLTSWRSDYYERIGVSFELPNHFLRLTARENLTYFGALYGRTTRQPAALLEMVGLGADGDLLVSQYSKGMKNRLTFARALLHNPELLFLDEPTAGLDPVNARRIKNLIAEQRAAGKTVFLTTHDMAVADELCDRVAFIVDGRIALIDTPRQLKLQYGRASVQVEYHVNGRMSQQEFPLPGLGDNGSFLHLLKTQPVETIHTQEATLENIFIQVTGRALIA